MDSLPSELVALICDHCDHASLKNLRLVDRRFNVESTAAVFESCYIGLFEFTLDRLHHLVNSRLSKHVRKLTMFSDILPDWSKEGWLAAIDYRPDYSSWLATNWKQREMNTSKDVHRFNPQKDYGQLQFHQFTEKQLDDAWMAFRKCLKEQFLWRQDNQGTRLKELLSSLPNLSEASVKCTTPFSGKTNKWPVWKSLRERIFVGPDDWRYTMDHFSQGSYAEMCGNAALALTEAVGYRETFSGITSVTKLEVHSTHLGSYQELLQAQGVDDLGVPSMGYRVSLNGVALKPTARHNLRVEGFRNLTGLRLHIPHATLSWRFHGSGLQQETIQFLRAAKNLQTLDLRYTDDELSPDDEIPQLQTLFNSDEVLWPKLRKLSLATNIESATLLKFLQNQSTTLVELELRDMLIVNVEEALKQIPQVLKLQQVYAECLWDDSPGGEFLSVLSRGTDFNDPYEKAVKAYLLQESDKFSTLEWDGGRGSDVLSAEEDASQSDSSETDVAMQDLDSDDSG